MKYYVSPSHHAAYNQALEEQLYLNYPGEDFLLLWRNQPAVVSGKFQNIYQEVNILEARDQGVSLVRRISGGGTVYHDLGNINYSLIGHRDGLGADYRPILEKVCSSLDLLGAEVKILDEISLGVGGLKISGSAQAASQDRLLHHGTLLYDSDLSALKHLANGHNENFTTRGTQSVPWPVGNLRNHLHKDLGDSEAFLQTWLETLRQVFGADEEYQLSASDRVAIEQLYREKYCSWAWTFAQGPAFSFSRQIPLQAEQATATPDIILKRTSQDNLPALAEKTQAVPLSSPPQLTPEADVQDFQQDNLPALAEKAQTVSPSSPPQLTPEADVQDFQQDNLPALAEKAQTVSPSSPPQLTPEADVQDFQQDNLPALADSPTIMSKTSYFNISQLSYTAKKGVIKEFACEPACPVLTELMLGARLEPQTIASLLAQVDYQHLLPYFFS